MPFTRAASTAGLAVASTTRDVRLEGQDPVLASRFELGLIAATALLELGDAAADLADAGGGATGTVQTSVLQGAHRLISFGLQKLNGQAVPRTNQGNPFVRAYQCADDRWIYLHGGFDHLTVGLATLLDVSAEAGLAEVGQAVKAWKSSDLEAAIARERLCGALIRTPGEWRAHPQGQALAELPLVRRTQLAGDRIAWEPHPVQPLAGLRVLDLTRVLAGPTCGKYLAALGADVLHVRGSELPSVPSFVLDTGLGKRQAWCDFNDPSELAQLTELAMRSHVIVTGYRPGVVDRFGLGSGQLRANGWNGVYGSISCYGPEGPWANRAGWEQLAQAATGMQSIEGGISAPAVTPAAATDYTTGLAMAGAVCRALATPNPTDLHGSLCQTASWILRQGAICDPQAASGGDPSMAEVQAEFGTLTHLDPGFTVEGLQIGWSRPPRPLGSGQMRW